MIAIVTSTETAIESLASNLNGFGLPPALLEYNLVDQIVTIHDAPDIDGYCAKTLMIEVPDSKIRRRIAPTSDAIVDQLLRWYCDGWRALETKNEWDRLNSDHDHIATD
jgi:hypothetical protein